MGVQPNIVVILADDMGYGDVACQNPESKIPTPNLDRLASQGVRFTDAHSPSAVCTPTRYGLLTGTYCWRTELKSSVLWAWDEPLIDEETLTLPAMLRNAGYHTACIGKWHLGWDWPTKDGTSINDRIAMGTWDNKMRGAFGDNIDFTKPIGGGPTARGFDYYFGDDVPNFPPYTFIENDRVTEIPTVNKPDDMFGSPGPMVEGWDLTKVMPTITEKAVAYIEGMPARRKRSDPDSPFFLYFPLTAPHTPIAPTEEFIGTSDAHRYGDFVAEVDWTVGQVMDALERSGHADNTLIIFSSDNGSPARDGSNMNGKPRSVLEYGHNPSHMYRGIKTDAWEGGHRVPFIVRWPRQIPAGTVSNQLIGLNDIMATCADITREPLAADTAIDSVSLLPTLTDDVPVRESLVHHSYHGTFAIRVGDWKYIDGGGGGGWDKPSDSDEEAIQLYNLRNDPSEQHNLASSEPERVAQMHQRLNQTKSQTIHN